MKKLEEEYFNEPPEEDIIPPKDIVAFNELRSCADLYRMATSDSMEIKPFFQRDEVWPPSSQTRFIDSLVKQLPIPSMCISIDYNTEERIVIDGLQRISTIIKFLSKEEWRLSKLDDISPEISGKTNLEIKKEYPKIYERIQNMIIPITVLRYNSKKKQHSEYIFTIFHRLNTLGVKLSNQEIRNCIYSGSTNNLLKELNENESWKTIQGMRSDRSYRYKKVELILRFLAFHDWRSKYEGKLTLFLNNYMDENRNPQKSFLDNKKDLFLKTLGIIKRLKRIKEIKGYAQWETLLYGIGKNIGVLETLGDPEINKRFDSLLKYFSSIQLISGIYSKRQVLDRLKKSERIFLKG